MTIENNCFTKKVLLDNPEFLTTKGRFDVEAYYRQLLPQLKDLCEIQRTPVKYSDGREHGLVRIASRGIKEGSKVDILTSLFHANELHALFLWLTYGREIFDYAKTKGVHIIAYPIVNEAGLAALALDNPHQIYSGAALYDDKQRNGCFVYYQLTDGRIVDDLGANLEYKRWFLATQNAKVVLPAETLAMIDAIDYDFSLRANILCYGDNHGEINDPVYIFRVTPKSRPDKPVPYRYPGFYFYEKNDSVIYAPLYLSQIKFPTTISRDVIC
ncbi:hypothetical protein HY030_04280 [Candidatus Gottesmanbacteria bacterium]|nr:hypothetical protein [Candidatus Gottesmanbacteria bacterium]